MGKVVSDFSGKVALVTGAASGMGLATAQAFSKAGAAVTLADSNYEVLTAAANALTESCHRVPPIVCDVSDEEQVSAMVQQTVSMFGRLDAAFNNAGIQAPPCDAADEPVANFDKVNAVNLRGVWACMKHELKRMREQGGEFASTRFARGHSTRRWSHRCWQTRQKP